jgi:hypothetical protein
MVLALEAIAAVWGMVVEEALEVKEVVVIMEVMEFTEDMEVMKFTEDMEVVVVLDLGIHFDDPGGRRGPGGRTYIKLMAIFIHFNEDVSKIYKYYGYIK